VRIVYAVENHYWEDMNLLDGLRQVGHEVVVHRPGYPFHQALSPSWTAADRQRVSERLVDAVRREHQRRPVDVLFGYLLNQLVYPEAIREISDMGILTMNYWCNGAHQFYLVDEISPAFDVCIVTERAALPSYEAVGAHAVYLQMAANPERYRPYALPVEYDVTFVGQRYADRPELVLYLLQQGIDVREYGEKDVGLALTPGFVLRHPRAAVLRTAAHLRSRARRRKTISADAERRLARIAGPSLPYQELIRMYSRSRISLGFSTTGDARYDDPVKIRQIHLRDFEAPMSGAAYFVEFQEELTEFYDLDREIVCYSSREELAAKVSYYLDRPDEVRRLRRAGHERARRDHTWARRFQDLFSRVVV
jgi:hypothetical protein